MLIVGLTGLAGSGKTTLAKYLESKGFKILIFSDILKKEAERKGLLHNKGLEEEKAVLANLGDTMRREANKNEILAIKLVDEIKSNKYEKVVVDGFRAPEEVEYFRDNFNDFILIGLETLPDIRVNRRIKDDPNADKKEILMRDEIDIDFKGLGKVMKMTDFKIINNGSLESLYNQIDTILK